MTHDRRHVREIFMEVAELPHSERGAALERLCGADAALRNEVEVLLRADRQAAADQFMNNPTDPVEPSTVLAPITERAGSRIGPYKLLQQIGEGGFGVVFMAEQEKPVRRRVALKIIKLGMDTRQIVARFEQERQALALMDHPNIAKVLDAGATESGRPYFVMEYVSGDPITSFADAHKLSVRDRLELFTQVCSAVQHAHTKGVIHRDIKPSNVLASMVDGRPFGKVIDFGIAKATGAAGGRLTEKTLFTEHRQLIGTPEYMSPEQAEGSPDIDTRTDVYGLGVLLYELLTALTPFDARRLRSAAWEEMRRIIREEEPLSPSLQLVRRLGGTPTRNSSCPTSGNSAFQAGSTPNVSVGTNIQSVPNCLSLDIVAAARKTEPAKLSALIQGELDWIVMKALDKDRARRYETASALADDVRRHLTGEPVVAAPPSAAYRLRKFVKKNRGPVLAGSAVATALLLGIAGTSIGFLKYKAENQKLTESTELGRSYLGKVMNELSDGKLRGSVLSVTQDDGADVTHLELWANVGEAAIDNIRQNRSMRQEAEAKTRHAIEALEVLSDILGKSDDAEVRSAQTHRDQEGAITNARARGMEILELGQLAKGLAENLVKSRSELKAVNDSLTRQRDNAATALNEIGAIIEGKPFDLAGAIRATVSPLQPGATQSDAELAGLIATAKSLAQQTVAANASLQEQTKIARLAEADIIVSAFEHADAGGADDEYLATLNFDAAVAARATYLGPAHVDTVHAEWLGAKGSLKDEARFAKLSELIARRDATHEPPMGIDIRLWSSMSAELWSRGDLDGYVAYLRRIGKHLLEAHARDRRRVIVVAYPWIPGNVFVDIRTVEACADAARLLQSVTLATAYRTRAHAAAPKDARADLDRAEEIDAQSGHSPHPANLAIRGALTIRSANTAELRALASQLLNQADELAKSPTWENNPECQYWIKLAKGRLSRAEADTWGQDPDVKSLLDEAVELIDGQAPRNGSSATSKPTTQPTTAQSIIHESSRPIARPSGVGGSKG